MISEHLLGLVSGGNPPPIELNGFFGSIMTSVGEFFTTALSFGNYEARDDMGQSGTVKQVNTCLSPIGCGKILDIRKERVTVLNSDNMRDLNGTSVSFAATASLPPIVQRGLSDKFGRVTADHCAILTGKGIGAEFTLPVKTETGRHDVLCKVTRITDQQVEISGAGLGKFGIDIHGSANIGFATVENVDQVACAAYLESKRT